MDRESTRTQERELGPDTATPGDLERVCESVFRQQQEDASAVTDTVRGLHFVQVSRQDSEGRIALHRRDDGGFEVHFWDREERPLSGIVKISPGGRRVTQLLPVPHHKHPVEKPLDSQPIFGVISRIMQAEPIAA
jgi:hypothetical protein